MRPFTFKYSKMSSPHHELATKLRQLRHHILAILLEHRFIFYGLLRDDVRFHFCSSLSSLLNSPPAMHPAEQSLSFVWAWANRLSQGRGRAKGTKCRRHTASPDKSRGGVEPHPPARTGE